MNEVAPGCSFGLLDLRSPTSTGLQSLGSQRLAAQSWLALAPMGSEEAETSLSDRGAQVEARLEKKKKVFYSLNCLRGNTHRCMLMVQRRKCSPL